MGKSLWLNSTLIRCFSSYKVPNIILTPRMPEILNIADKKEFRAILTKPIFTLKDLFEKNNYEIRIAGGAVRDILMGKQAADLDFASTATPTQMKEMFETEGIRMLHKKGEEHGTITCRIDETNLEVTTLRIDVLCDGRRAEVQYTTDWQLDANRRDLTINSMFLDFNGNVIDYFNGIEDVKNRRVAFVGDAESRIQEDFLRILRYFRFFGRISENKVHDAETLEAIKRNKDGLKGISAERIWTELKRIVVGRLAPDVMECMMVECGLCEVLGLPPPEECDLERFRQVYELYPGKPEAMALISVLVKTTDAVTKFHRHMKCSNNESYLGDFVTKKLSEAEKEKNNLKWFKDGIAELLKPGGVGGVLKNNSRSFNIQLLMAALADMETVEALEAWEFPHFPITGTDLMEIGVPRGPAMKDVLMKVYEHWQEKNFEIEKPALLQKATEIALEIKNKRKRSPSSERSRKKSENESPASKKPVN